MILCQLAAGWSYKTRGFEPLMAVMGSKSTPKHRGDLELYEYIYRGVRDSKNRKREVETTQSNFAQF